MMNRGNQFSYAEVILIAIVLGAVGKMIVPQFTAASGEESKISELADGLEAMRVQLDLYCVHHGDVLPPTDSFASFETAMTTKDGQRGPYIQEIPTNPFNGLNTVRFDGKPAGNGKAGWRLDTKTGLFQADNDAACAAL
jgi:type II secretory pathway pseudopilin PulG